MDTPFLARVVPHLAPETLHQLLQYRGLDACVELLTSATPAQLTSLFDLDLWRHAQPGRDEEFDVERFGQWLEVLVRPGRVTSMWPSADRRRLDEGDDDADAIARRHSPALSANCVVF